MGTCKEPLRGVIKPQTNQPRILSTHHGETQVTHRSETDHGGPRLTQTGNTQRRHQQAVTRTCPTRQTLEATQINKRHCNNHLEEETVTLVTEEEADSHPAVTTVTEVEADNHPTTKLSLDQDSVGKDHLAPEDKDRPVDGKDRLAPEVKGHPVETHPEHTVFLPATHRPTRLVYQNLLSNLT